jgi:gamma-glutamylcyclotransferase
MALPIVGAAHEQAAPEGFTWFIYSSSLSRRAFAEWAERHHYEVPDFSRAVPARLSEHRLVFDVQSGFWGGAVASVEPAAGHSVEGIALPLPGAARTLVDHKEGALSGLYEPFAAKVLPLAGGPAMDSLVFRASPNRRLPAEAPPSPSFVAALREGAKDFGLSATYQAELAKLAIK